MFTNLKGHKHRKHPLKRTYQIKKKYMFKALQGQNCDTISNNSVKHLQSNSCSQTAAVRSLLGFQAALQASDQQVSVKSSGRCSARFSASALQKNRFGLHQVSVLQSFLLFLLFHWEKVQLCHTWASARLTPVNSTSSLSISCVTPLQSWSLLFNCYKWSWHVMSSF